VIKACYGFAWQGFGSGRGYRGGFCEKLPPCLIKPVPAISKVDLLLPKAQPISNCGSTSPITYLRKGKKKTVVRQ